MVAKTKFSMCTEEIDAELGKLGAVRKVLIVGLETHVCVLQTSLDLLGEFAGTQFSAMSAGMRRLASGLFAETQ